MSTAEVVKSALPKPLSSAQFDKVMRENAPGLRIYNPSDQWEPFDVHAITYHLPPDLEGSMSPHPATGDMVKCDGVRQIRNRYLKQKDSSGKPIEGQTADAIVKHIVDRANGGDMGIVFLPGVSPEEDDQLKAYGRQKFLEYRQALDEKVINARREFVVNWKGNAAKKGEPVPPPSSKEIAAIERAAEREQVKQYAFECEIEDCATGYATNEWAKFARHMKVVHGINAPSVAATASAAGEDVPFEDESEDEGGIAAAQADLAAKAPKVATKKTAKQRGKRG